MPSADKLSKPTPHLVMPALCPISALWVKGREGTDLPSGSSVSSRALEGQ